MAVYNLNRDMNTVEERGVDTMYWYSSGLYCRTQISVQSLCRIIGYQDTYGASRRNFRFAPFFVFMEVELWKEWKHSHTITLLTMKMPD